MYFSTSTINTYSVIQFYEVWQIQNITGYSSSNMILTTQSTTCRFNSD
jgi:hypothetical protein